MDGDGRVDVAVGGHSSASRVAGARRRQSGGAAQLPRACAGSRNLRILCDRRRMSGLRPTINFNCNGTARSRADHDPSALYSSTRPTIDHDPLSSRYVFNLLSHSLDVHVSSISFPSSRSVLCILSILSIWFLLSLSAFFNFIPLLSASVTLLPTSAHSVGSVANFFYRFNFFSASSSFILS